MDPDEVAYRKSVRNTVKVLAVIVAVLAAAIIATAYFDVTPNTFQTRTSIASAYPFTMTLATNATTVTSKGDILISAWLNGTSTGNVTSASIWAYNESRLVAPRCVVGFPVRVGVMQGHYTVDNYSLGSLLQVSQGTALCPVLATGAPAWFYFPSQESKVLVAIKGTPEYWNLVVSYNFGPASLGKAKLPPGVYTAVAADEWGDFVLTNFRVA